MARETYAQSIIKEIPAIIAQIKANVDGENYSPDFCSEQRAAINVAVITAVFGAEIIDTKNGSALKLNKKPATLAELNELSTQLAELVAIEDSIAYSDEEDIPGATSAAVTQLVPEKLNKKSLTEYLITGPQAIGRLQIGPQEVLTLASISEKYRKEKKFKIILVSAIAAAAVAAGVTTTAIIIANKKKEATDDAPVDVDVDEEEVVDDVDDGSITDETIPHVDLDM